MADEAKTTAEKASQLNNRLTSGVKEMSEWAIEARRAWNYYSSKQWSDLSESERKKVMPIVANVIRRDLDQMVGRVLDADPIINPVGRYGDDFQFGKLLVDLLQYTRDAEENWHNDLEDVVADFFFTGEGILHEGWNQDADDGLGMPEAKWVDPRFIIWDSRARSWQRDDAEWVIHFEPKRVDLLEEQWGISDVTADFPSLLVDENSNPTGGFEYGSRSGSNVAQRSGSNTPSGEDQAYEKTQYCKKTFFETVYQTPDGQIAQVPGDDGELNNITATDFNGLDEEQRGELTKVTVKREELWETVVVNDQIVKDELSVYDKSNGGHGHFPFAFFTYVRIRDRSHGKGEIDYLVGLQDLVNRTLSRWLEQMMIAGSNFIVSPKGSLPREDEEKLKNIGRYPMQIFRPYAGFTGPQVQGGQATGAEVFHMGYNILSQIKDKVSGVYDVQRGGMPYQTSGKGIMALQSATDILTTMPRRHLESGLKRATILRLGNIVQFMRGSRVVEVIDKAEQTRRNVFVGNSLGEIAAEFGLQPMPDPETGEPMVDPETGEPLLLGNPASGQPADTLVLNGDSREVDWKRIRLELDSERDRTKQERMDFAQMVMQAIGPPAIPWAMELMDAPNKEILITEIEKNNAAGQMMAQFEELGKQVWMPPDQLAQMAIQMIQQQAQQAQQQEEGGPPQPQGPPPQPQGPAAQNGAAPPQEEIA